MAGQNHKGTCLHCDTQCSTCHHQEQETKAWRNANIEIPLGVIAEILQHHEVDHTMTNKLQSVTVKLPRETILTLVNGSVSDVHRFMLGKYL